MTLIEFLHYVTTNSKKNIFIHLSIFITYETLIKIFYALRKLFTYLFFFFQNKIEL